MADDTRKTEDAAQAADSEMVQISVPHHLAEPVREFVRKLESEDADTQAHMMSMLIDLSTSDPSIKIER